MPTPWHENYTSQAHDNRQFDRRYWQALGPQAIFDAAADMARDYLLLKGGDAHQPRLHRTAEHFGKA